MVASLVSLMTRTAKRSPFVNDKPGRPSGPSRPNTDADLPSTSIVRLTTRKAATGGVWLIAPCKEKSGKTESAAPASRKRRRLIIVISQSRNSGLIYDDAQRCG